ncbi:MAG TPA: hypothetical protein VG146_01810 [Verrucomicrobiae bacterium]|nr:hypothetical protein [Verrucomicrobiae bacterium]
MSFLRSALSLVTQAVKDLFSGKINALGLAMLALAGFVGWWLWKKLK